MSKRHEMIGIKQIVHLECMDKALELILAGLEPKTIRAELGSFVKARSGNMPNGPQSDQTIAFTLTNLMNIWVTPAPDLIPLRDDLLTCCRSRQIQNLTAHWAMISASYPFWFNVAKQVGRLFNLQERITQSQIINRIKEQYGDRQTVSRFGRYVIRSFVAWGVICDTHLHGCYEKSAPIIIETPIQSRLMFEAALQALPEGRASLDALCRNPAFFPFQFMIMPKTLVAASTRIETSRYNLDSEMVSLKH